MHAYFTISFVSHFVRALPIIWSQYHCLLSDSDGLPDVVSSSSFGEKKNVLSHGRIASGDLPLDMNKWTNNCNFSINDTSYLSQFA